MDEICEFYVVAHDYETAVQVVSSLLMQYCICRPETLLEQLHSPEYHDVYNKARLDIV